MRIDLIEILDDFDWREFNDSYTHTYHNIGNDQVTRGMCVGEEKTEVVDMNKGRPCSYSSKTYSGGKVINTRIIKAPNNLSRRPGAECNGFTLRQLRAVMENIMRKLVAEEWTGFNNETLTLEEVSLYDVNCYIILPYTSRKKTYFVRALLSTAGARPPKCFVNRWWGELVMQFIQCLEQAVVDFRMNMNNTYYAHESMGEGSAADTPVWVCAYSNNQWSLGDTITENPKESGITKAMNVAKGHTITILDEKGVVFTQIWCVFELFLTLTESKDENTEGKLEDGLWAVYITHTHTYIYSSRLQSTREAKRDWNYFRWGNVRFW